MSARPELPDGDPSDGRRPGVDEQEPEPPPEPVDPLRIAVGALPRSVSMALLRSALRRIEVGDDRVTIIGPAGRRWPDRRARPGPAGRAAPATDGLQDLGQPDLEAACRELLRDGHRIVVVVADTVGQRGRVEETLAESGGLVVSPAGKVYP